MQRVCHWAFDLWLIMPWALSGSPVAMIFVCQLALQDVFGLFLTRLSPAYASLRVTVLTADLNAQVMSILPCA